jgi:hypothetical protein
MPPGQSLSAAPAVLAMPIDDLTPVARREYTAVCEAKAPRPEPKTDPVRGMSTYFRMPVAIALTGDYRRD